MFRQKLFTKRKKYILIRNKHKKKKTTAKINSSKASTQIRKCIHHISGWAQYQELLKKNIKKK